MDFKFAVGRSLGAAITISADSAGASDPPYGSLFVQSIIYRTLTAQQPSHIGNATASWYSPCRISTNRLRLSRPSFLCVQRTHSNRSGQSNGIHAN